MGEGFGSRLVGAGAVLGVCALSAVPGPSSWDLVGFGKQYTPAGRIQNSMTLLIRESVVGPCFESRV